MTMETLRELPAQALHEMAEQGRLGREARDAGNLALAEHHFLAAWQAIPEPRLEYDYAGSLATAMVEFYRDAARHDDARAWLETARQAYGPQPDPSIDFLEATVCFEAGQTDRAFELFDALFRQYGRRPFQGVRSQYLAFYLERAGRA